VNTFAREVFEPHAGGLGPSQTRTHSHACRYARLAAAILDGSW